MVISNNWPDLALLKISSLVAEDSSFHLAIFSKIHKITCNNIANNCQRVIYWIRRHFS